MKKLRRFSSDANRQTLLAMSKKEVARSCFTVRVVAIILICESILAYFCFLFDSMHVSSRTRCHPLNGSQSAKALRDRDPRQPVEVAADHPQLIGAHNPQ